MRLGTSAAPGRYSSLRLRTIWGRPLVSALIAAEKGVSAILVAGGAWLAFFVHGKVVNNPLWLLFPSEMSESPRDLIFRILANHLPPMGPRTVLGIAVFLVFWAVLLAMESIGVWWDYAWGEALIIVETVSLMPVEIYHIWHHPALSGFGSLAVNLLILWYVARLYQRRMMRRAAAKGVGAAVPGGALAVAGGAPSAGAGQEGHFGPTYGAAGTGGGPGRHPGAPTAAERDLRKARLAGGDAAGGDGPV